MEAVMGDNKRERDALDRLVDALVDDVLRAPDEEILAEDGDPELHDTQMRALFERSVITVNKRRLADAKAGVAADRRTTGRTPSVDITEARKRLRDVLDTSGAPDRLTLAARKESELSDRDVVGMLDDLRELGLLPPASEWDDIS
jgi:hypothetical protein